MMVKWKMEDPWHQMNRKSAQKNGPAKVRNGILGGIE
jgi:hypothetical protein